MTDTQTRSFELTTEWQRIPSKLLFFAKKIKLVHGRAWVPKLPKTNSFRERCNCVFEMQDSGSEVLLGPIIQQDEDSWCIVMRPGASVQCNKLLNFSVDGPKTSTVFRTRKRAYEPDPDSNV